MLDFSQFKRPMWLLLTFIGVMLLWSAWSRPKVAQSTPAMDEQTQVESLTERHRAPLAHRSTP